MSVQDQPLFSIFIPTFNRPAELSETLRILDAEMRLIDKQSWPDFEIVVSDNASPGNVNPAGIVKPYADWPLRAKLFEQERNIGPTLNFESCFQRARGRYILLLSDDDHLTTGSLALIHAALKNQDPDVLFLPFRPNRAPSDAAQRLERNEFVKRLGYLPTLVSSCILKRALIEPVLGRYLDTNMHHFFYYLTAVERGETFLRLDREVLFSPYVENQGGYNWFRTFGEEFPKIVREFPRARISHHALSSVLAQLLRKLIVPTFLNRKIKGVLINNNFANEKTWPLVKIVTRNYGSQPTFWWSFVPLMLTPALLLRGLKRVYLWQKSFLFHWDPI